MKTTKIISLFMVLIFFLSAVVPSLAVIVMMGDVNEDGIINSRDMALIQKHLLQITTLKKTGLVAADYNMDGTINSRDIAKLQLVILDVIVPPVVDTEEGTHIIEFMLNDGTDKVYEIQKIVDGTLAEMPEMPERDGFAFVGWYNLKTSGTRFDFSKPVAKSCKVFAHWVDIADTTDIDGDGITDPVEKFYGTNPALLDTDGDGLSDYAEIVVLNYDPLNKDTDDDGILDGKEDFDEDGINNKAEAEIGTEPSIADTDGDDLDDKSEKYTYKTDPCQYDTDGDGVSDGDELVLELNPLTRETDGITLDSERKFTQELDIKNINGNLIAEENIAVPSLTLTTSGNINSRVSIVTADISKFGDSRAVTGEPIEIVGKNLGEGIISFKFKNSDLMSSVKGTGGSFNTKIICKYNQDGFTEYLDTTFNAEKNAVSAAVNGEGTYFVLDVKNLFDELGLAMPIVSEVSTLTDPEPIVTYSMSGATSTDEGNFNNNETDKVSAFTADKTTTNTESASADAEKMITRNSSGAMAQADIVFLIDTTGSMENAINNVKENVGHFVDALKEKGVSAGLALIDYQDIEEDGYDSTRVHKNGTSNWFYDMERYKTVISALELGYGGDLPECAVDALETARMLDMRPSAKKVFILVTDANYKVNNRYGISSMKDEINLIKDSGITCAVVSPKNEQSTYYDLYNETNGVWANIYGDFYTELMSLADKIGNDIVSDGYWIYLAGPLPISVKLKAEPKVGSVVDTDEDGICDIDELEGAVPTIKIDLDALIKKISHGLITDTNYGVLAAYKYKSNPAEVDTDKDGYIDKEDSNALIWDVSDRDLAMFAALTYETREKYNDRSIDDNYYFLKYAHADEVYKYWGIVDCSGEKWADLATHFFATTYKNGNNIIIAYRGTDAEWGEWFNNIVGVGILNFHSEEWHAKNYAKKIAKLYPECNIYITGHSLGGYLAQIGAAEIIQNHNPSKLRKVAYFNGIGLAYNQRLYLVKKDEINALKKYYNNDKYNPNLISYNIYGDVVSALGTHCGAIIPYQATTDAIAQHRKKYDSQSLAEFILSLNSRLSDLKFNALSQGISIVLSVVSSENIFYYYNYYRCSSITEYFWITHETDSFFYYLKAGIRNGDAAIS